MAKEGSTVSGLMDTFATAISLALQYGVPLRDLVNKFAHVRFEPSGSPSTARSPSRKSITTTSTAGWEPFQVGETRAALGIQERGRRSAQLAARLRRAALAP